MMGMLRAGGIDVLSDDERPADEDNPLGYFELRRVRSLAVDGSWLESARGRAIKVVSPLLQHLPRHLHYRVLFMQRDLDEVLESQERVLEHRGLPRRPADPGLRAQFVAHLAVVLRMLRADPAFDALEVPHGDLMRSPDATVARVALFLGSAVDAAAMCRCIDPALHRVRRG